jgi:hypothetical protein
MAVHYAAIRAKNQRRYGTDIGRIGPMLLANRYDDRTHFIYELLQNAEDALARRTTRTGSRSIRFSLEEATLRVSHFGKPFDEADVRGICGIAESTKDLTAIGRFGIGFKSVYAFTDRPEVYSGPESFAIENFVWPIAVPDIPTRTPDETVIVLPLREREDRAAIVAGLHRLGARTLLFLRQIEEIEWTVEGGPSGRYLRSAPESFGELGRRVTVVGQTTGAGGVEESWLLFGKPICTNDGKNVGSVEVAFSLGNNEESGREMLRPISQSPLVVFFPTALETNLGFLVQGPYRTTPSRDNVPQRDPWNVKLVQETAALLLDALRSLRSGNLLDVTALLCLPIERAKYPEGSMFAPLFDAVRSALASEPLLPRAVGGWTAAKNARLARTQELRELFDSKQLAALLGSPEEVHWLSGDITRDTAATLRNYLLYELKVSELTPELVLPRLTKQFLEAQPDPWILRLYEFLGGQSALVRQGRVGNIPLVRIEDGTHVVAQSNGQPRAFLPSAIRTDFPTVRKSVCGTEKALEFLKALGLTEPDAVDDVVRNVIPKYEQETVKIDGDEYEADIRRMLNAFDTQHRGQRDKLIAALKDTTFVMSVDAGDGSRHLSKPGDVYLATQRLKELFAGVPGVMLVDDSCSCLKGEKIRELLEACDAVRHLRPVANNSLSWEERSELRVQADHPETSGQNDRVTDWTLLGLDELLSELPRLDVDKRRTKARLLWEELGNLEEGRGKGVFTGEYTWTHYGRYRSVFDAAFVRKLNETAWVPDDTGNLQRPELVLFDSLGWDAHAFLQSKIRFKPPLIEQLAKEAGFDPEVLDLLKRMGITRADQLQARLGVEKTEPIRATEPNDVNEALRKLGIAETPTAPAPDPTAGDPVPEGVDPADATTRPGGRTSSGGYTGGGGGRGTHTGTGSQRTGTAGNKPTSGDRSTRSFISYVATHPGEEEADPDGLDHEHRLALEAKAIEFILSRERQWQRTPPNNPGFDLYQAGSDGQPVRWCEVKAMTGTLHDRPVGLSRMQFECAREHGEAYWLYVVECAGTDEARLIRIQDPAGKARTFTFDHGWLDIAETDSEEEP